MKTINKKIIGIIGPAGSGKSTLAELLQRDLSSATICSFAEPLRHILHCAGLYNNPWRTTQCDNFERGVSVRSSLIALRRCFGEIYGKDIFVKMMEKEINGIMSRFTTIIIDDVCMTEELNWIQEQGAIIIVLMPSLEKKPDKIPEAEKLAWEIIENPHLFCDFPIFFSDDKDKDFASVAKKVKEVL
jgi:ABC-type cobalamin/Fe3+-siderophores transport system ATPase subunit